MKRNKRNHGVITVLVSLLLVGILSLGTVTIEAGRLQAAKTQLAEANISASTSMIASYNNDLYGRFGLLAIDTERFKQERAADYLNYNADQAFGYQGNNLARLYVMQSLELDGVYNLTYPSLLKRQVLTRAKYHVVAENYALNIKTMDAFFAEFQQKCLYVARKLEPVADGDAFDGALTDVSQEMQDALAALYTASGNFQPVDTNLSAKIGGAAFSQLPSHTGTVESHVPAEDLRDINSTLNNASTLLGGDGTVLRHGGGAAVSETDVHVSVDFVQYMTDGLMGDLTSEGTPYSVQQEAKHIVAMAKGFNAALNALSGDKEGNYLLNAYITHYFPNRTRTVRSYSGPQGGNLMMQDSHTFVGACVEYMFGGDRNEMANQAEAYNYVQAIRLISNLHAVLSSSNSFNAYNKYSVAAHIAWANMESMIDARLMAKYGVSIPFNKNRLILNVNDPAVVATAFSENEYDIPRALNALGLQQGDTFVVPGYNSFTYTDCLMFALWFTPNTTKLMRLADLIQLEMQHREYKENGTANFLMSEQNTFCRIKCIARFNAALPMISLDPENSTQGVVIQSVKYSGY